MRRLLVLLLLLLCLPAPGAQAALATTEGQATYVPLDPSRVLDTRYGTGGYLGKVGPGGVVDVALADAPAGAVAAVLTVTATGATATTNVRVYPTPASGSAVPTVSNLNVVAGVTVANSVTTKLGSGATVRLRNEAGAVHLLADLAGFYVVGSSGSGFVSAAPRRVLDTRETGTPLQGGVPRTLDTQVPAGATAAVLNVTVVTPSQTTFATVYPGPTRPVASNLNPVRGVTVAGLVTVKVSAGTVQLYLATGTAHVVVDLAGWYLPDAGDYFHPVDPYRYLDTRGGGAVRADSPQTKVLAGRGRLPWLARSVALNVTAVAPAATTAVTVYPFQSESPNPPRASSINALRGAVVPNAVVVPTGEDGAVRLAVSGGTSDLLVDVAGWFAPVGDGWDISWPQCTSAGATTSNHPDGGAFAVVGVTHGTFRESTCLADELAWANTLAGPAAVYVNVDADVDNAHWADPGPRQVDCSAKQDSVECGFNYGWNLASFARDRFPTAADGGKPFVWFDVEGPYPGGPYWTSKILTNREVLVAAMARLTSIGYRVGIYTDRPSSSSPDWKNIFGAWSRPDLQNWVFRATSTTAASVCGESGTGGPTLMEQISTTQSGQSYDVDHVC